MVMKMDSQTTIEAKVEVLHATAICLATVMENKFVAY